MPTQLLPHVAQYTHERLDEFSQISDERKADLEKIANFISNNKEKKQTDLIFICTHNSRRSHLSQIWAQTAAHFYGFKNVKTYSGGTESTAFNPRAVHALEKAGFEIEKKTGGDNPVYMVTYSSMDPTIKAFSKKFSHQQNPQQGFCAVLTCSQADDACPFVPGAEERIAIPYDDPKAFDGTDQEEPQYDERCRQIAREMLYIFSKVEVLYPASTNY